LSNSTHEAVMTEEVLENLILSKKGLYVDCTFGSGGHSSKILEQLDKEGKLVSMDKDRNATNLLSEEFIKDSRFKIINDSFSKLSSYIDKETAQGVLIDLGISSTQLDDSERGFSFQTDGPLDRE
jgi:Predicted S-adenosylmethionine-dependent methyltransferase involved in cell envelope biogenesis